MLRQQLGLHHDEAVDRIDAGAPEPIGLDLGDVGNELRIGPGCRRLGVLLPGADRRAGAADPGADR